MRADHAAQARPARPGRRRRDRRAAASAAADRLQIRRQNDRASSSPMTAAFSSVNGHGANLFSTQLAVHPIGTFSENRRTHPDMGGSFLDGHLEIPAHAHAEGGQRNAGVALQFIAQFAQRREPAAASPPPPGRAEECTSGPTTSRRFNDSSAPISRRIASVSKPPLLCSPPMLTWRKTCGKSPSSSAISSVYSASRSESMAWIDLEARQDFAHLVALDPADEMPVQGAGQHVDFGFRLLQLALAEGQLPGLRPPHARHPRERFSRRRSIPRKRRRGRRDDKRRRSGS